MLEHLSETQNPHNEWLWLRSQYKKGMRYIEYTMGITNIVDQNLISWSYEEMMHNLKEGKHFCMFCFESQSPEELLQEIVKDKNSKDGILKRVFKFFGKLDKT